MRTDTRTALIDDATALVRRHGYAGFSYADLSEAVGIRKPSIHHHFPLKEDLGAAIVEAYSLAFADRLSDILARSGDRTARLREYAGLYREGLLAGEGCLCGVLASELAGLPDKVRLGVQRFFAVNLRWLEEVLQDGKPPRGTLGANVTGQQARMVLATLQGAVFVALAMNAPETFEAAVDGLLAALFPKPPKPG